MRTCFSLLVGLLSLSQVARAQAPTPPAYRNLVLEGGGIRGIAYGGALQELESRGVLAGIRRVGGTSAGAIQAALLAVGYSAQEIVEVVNATPIQRLNDGRFIFFGGTHRLVKQYGWYRGDEFSRYLSELVARKTQRPDLTLGELHALALAQPGRYRDLYTTGTNLTQQRSQVFSHETTPHHARGRCRAHQHEHSALLPGRAARCRQPRAPRPAYPRPARAGARGWRPAGQLSHRLV